MPENTLKLAIVGYGQMGKEIERLVNEDKRYAHCQISEIFDTDNQIDTSKDYDFDVAIEFTEPDSVLPNLEKLCKLGKNVVVGTTGWHKEMHQVEQWVEESGNGLVWATNFSVGVQMFFQLVTQLGKLVNHEAAYDIMTHEFHHRRKKDSPGGTALTIAKRLLAEIDSKKSIVTEELQRKIDKTEIHASSTRGGEIFGIHMVLADSLEDTIEMTHRAKGRSGFASGSLDAAIWVSGKKGVHEFGQSLQNKWGIA
ncbi:MAG: 4-hydroxy-tetrahydrodipicolinate reductase [Candidatus Kapaibacteriales bacterium]